MTPADQPRRDDAPAADFVRDPLANRAAVLAARRRPMSERLELAVSWNRVASQLRAGLAQARSAERQR
ncbi:MAG: hypothetical protein M3N56_12190 [Actinomycetota bacterium]|nr:hypothetical protein [Actinomycetota bacterium]